MITVVELRNYTLRRGGRESFVELFEREFVETQEAVGMHLLGMFRVPTDPNRFVWLRGHESMDDRLAGMTAFYDGPVWAKHRDAANRNIVDADNVLLLRPTTAPMPPPDRSSRAPVGAATPPSGLLAVVCHEGNQPPDAGEVIATFETERSANNFPRHSMREGEDVRVSLHRFPTVDEAVDAAASVGPVEHVVLQPTARSLIR